MNANEQHLRAALTQIKDLANADADDAEQIASLFHQIDATATAALDVGILVSLAPPAWAGEPATLLFPGCKSAYLSVEDAKRVRDALDAFISENS